MTQKLEAELFEPSDFAPTSFWCARCEKTVSDGVDGHTITRIAKTSMLGCPRMGRNEMSMGYSANPDGTPTLHFPGGDVPMPARLGGEEPGRTTREPELIRNVLVEVMSKLDALVDFTDSDGEWKDRVRLARRELGRANVAAAREPFEPVPARRRYLEQL